MGRGGHDLARVGPDHAGRQRSGYTAVASGHGSVDATGTQWPSPVYLAWLAEALGHSGQVDEGLRLLTEALATVDNTGERWWEAELYRLKGALLLEQTVPDACQAEACFQQALAIARRQQARSRELRAVLSLSRLWQRQGKRAAAYDVLAPVYDWFTEGFDTPDLQDAKTLLEDLS